MEKPPLGDQQLTASCGGRGGRMERDAAGGAW